jgi:hypothetical protein
MARTKRYTTTQVANALKRNAGLRSHAAKALKCSPTTVRKYIDASAKLQEVERECVESTLDLAENALIENVTAGKEPSVFFYLKCKGKLRGYREKDETITLDTLRRIMEELAVAVTKHVKDNETLRAIESDWGGISF